MSARIEMAVLRGTSERLRSALTRKWLAMPKSARPHFTYGLCPFVEEHTQHGYPDHDYMNWSCWAHEMAKTHNNYACAGCGFFVMWRPKRGMPPAPVSANGPGGGGSTTGEGDEGSPDGAA